VTDGKRITVRSQSILDLIAVNPLVTFYDIHGRKGDVLYFSDTTRDKINDDEINILQKYIFIHAKFNVYRYLSMLVNYISGN
jgi:hypothetical protein